MEARPGESARPAVMDEVPSGGIAFTDRQRRHSCTDCGYAYLGGEPDTRGEHFSRRVVGGGTVVSSTYGPVTEVHILPHGGTELPVDLLAEHSGDDLDELATLVHLNADIGTGAVYRELVGRIVAGQARGVAVAGFHLSRLMLDANRAEAALQVPRTPYVGKADLYQDYLGRHGEYLRREALLPWLAAVDDVLQKLDGDCFVYHHHTYDVRSMSPRPWDTASGAQRPAFQLVWRRPSPDSFDAGNHAEVPDDDIGLANREDLEGVQVRIQEFLESKMDVADGSGGIDHPLLLPPGPFVGTLRGDPVGAPRHVMYDLRKNILTTAEAVHLWVAEAPWRIEPAAAAQTGAVTSSLRATDLQMSAAPRSPR